jgi:hypothetical protein
MSQNSSSSQNISSPLQQSTNTSQQTISTPLQQSTIIPQQTEQIVLTTEDDDKNINNFIEDLIKKSLDFELNTTVKKENLINPVSNNYILLYCAIACNKNDWIIKIRKKQKKINSIVNKICKEFKTTFIYEKTKLGSTWSYKNTNKNIGDKTNNRNTGYEPIIGIVLKKNIEKINLDINNQQFFSPVNFDSLNVNVTEKETKEPKKKKKEKKRKEIKDLNNEELEFMFGKVYELNSQLIIEFKINNFSEIEIEGPNELNNYIFSFSFEKCFFLNFF